MTFVNSAETPINGTLLGRTSWRILWCWLLFFIHCYFCDIGCCCSFIAAFVMLVVVLRSLLLEVTPFYTFNPAHRRVICKTFILTFPGPSFTILPRAVRFWVSIFYPQAFFTLRSFPTFLPEPAFIKASLGVGSSSLKFARLHADPWNTDSAHLFVWFTAIHILDIQKNSYLNRIKYYHELLVVKSLVYLLLPRFKLFSVVQSICKDYKKYFEQDLYYL